MKKFLSLILAAILVCVSAVPCFALWNGKRYKLAMPKGFAETKSDDTQIVWDNESTGSSIIITATTNPKRLFYIDADEQTQKEFAKSFVSDLKAAADENAETNGYTLDFAEPKYGEAKFKNVSGFSIITETTKTTLDKSKSSVVDTEFYFFSTKDIAMRFQCILATDEDKAAVKDMFENFEIDGVLLTAENIDDSYPSPLFLFIPLAVIVLIVIIIIVAKKKKKSKTKAEAITEK